MFNYCYSSANMVEMQCLLQVAPSTILMGGHQDKLIAFDISRAEETSVVFKEILITIS
jgi:PAB-dependent poly(A)-specific ribonuclease subunit 2